MTFGVGSGVIPRFAAVDVGTQAYTEQCSLWIQSQVVGQ